MQCKPLKGYGDGCPPMYMRTKVSHREKTGDTVSAAAPCEKVIPSMSNRNGVLGGGSEAIP